MTIAAPPHLSPSGRWGWILLAGYILATLLSWLPFEPGLTRTIVRVILMTWISGASVMWLRALGPQPADSRLLTQVRTFVIAIAACGVLAAPMLTRDVWCYAAFARLAADGVDPYRVELPEALRMEFGDPFCGGTPTYGPVWIYGTAVIDRVVSPLGPAIEVLALKLVMAAAWLGLVLGVMSLQRSLDLRTRIVGLAAVSVVPISIFHLVAEAHNDVVMIALVVYWLVLRAKGSRLSPIPLLLSVLVKYVTAPLLLLAAIDAWRRGRHDKLFTALVSILVVVATTAFFFRDGALLTSLAKNNANWRWLSAPFAIEMIVKNLAPFAWVAPAVLAWRTVMALILAWYVRNWFKSAPTDTGLYRLVGVGMLALLFSADYLWPWYLIWALPFVVIAGDRLLSAVAWPFFVMLPIAQMAWVGGRRELGYRPEVILFLLSLVVVAWLVQAWIALRSPQRAALASRSV